MQSLIAGIIVITANCFITGTSFQTLSNFETFILEANIVLFLFFEVYIVALVSSIWTSLDLIINHGDCVKKQIKKTASELKPKKR